LYIYPTSNYGNVFLLSTCHTKTEYQTIFVVVMSWQEHATTVATGICERFLIKESDPLLEK